MELRLTRQILSARSTVGILTFDGQFECYTLEDVVRAPGVKIFGETAIPAGRYEVVINFSQRFKRMMPLLLNVPNFDGIRIHSGNTAENTEGCILVGLTKGDDQIGESRRAFANLFPKLVEAAKKEKIFITIR